MKHILIILLTILSFKAFGQEEVDRLSLAALLIKDGNFSKAQLELSKYNPEEDKDELKRYYTLKGLISLKQKNFEDARDYFLSAIKAKQKQESIYFHLAQAYYGLDQFDKALLHLKQVKKAKNPKYYFLKSSCFWKLKEHDKSFKVINEGLKRFPKNGLFYKQKITYLNELGLFQTAYDLQDRLFKLKRPEVNDFLLLATQFSSNGSKDHATKVLEKGLLYYPHNEKLLIELGIKYLKKEMNFSSARLFYRASAEDKKYLADTADIFNKIGKSSQALFLNSQIAPSKKKLKQRFAVLLDSELYELAITMDSSLSRVGLLKNEDIKYGLAFAWYMVGNFNRASALLGGIGRSDLFSKSIALRKAITDCKKDGWACIL